MQKIIEVYNISSKKEAVMGEIYQMQHFTMPTMVVVPDDEPANFLDDRVEILTSRIERVCHVDEFQNRTESYFTIDPRHYDRILALVSQCEIDRLKRAKMWAEKGWDKYASLVKGAERAGLFTRIKWLFLGVKL